MRQTVDSLWDGDAEPTEKEVNEAYSVFFDRVKKARKKYEATHPDRVRETKRNQAKARWQKTKADPEKLAQNRAYQAEWARRKRHKEKG